VKPAHWAKYRARSQLRQPVEFVVRRATFCPVMYDMCRVSATAVVRDVLARTGLRGDAAYCAGVRASLPVHDDCTVHRGAASS